MHCLITAPKGALVAVKLPDLRLADKVGAEG